MPMRVHPFGFGLLVCWLFVVSLCNADNQTVDIVGAAECADCQHNNLRTRQPFSGLHVTIDCKLKNGEMKRVGDAEVDDGGEFKLSLLKEIIHDGEGLKKECHAQLHNAAAAPCAAHDGLDTTKIVIKSQTENKIILAPAKTLRFSAALCTSKFLWPFFKYPPLPEIDPWKKKWPKITIPHLKNPGQPWVLEPKPKLLPPPLPIYKPLSPPIPVYKPIPKPPVARPPPPIYKPTPKPPVVKPPPPIYKPKPKPPIVKPHPPIYKPKPNPPAVKPLPPPVPIYEPPVVTKPLPPIFPLPPLHKKPCPPFAKILPKFKHHKFGYYFPKPPPFSSNPYP